MLNTPLPRPTLKDRLDRIVELDNQIRDLVRSNAVITLQDIGTFRQLKCERSLIVRIIQSSGKSYQS